MGGFKPRLSRKVWFFLSSAVMCLSAGIAEAACSVTGPVPPGTVPCKIVVQPIDVCEDSGTTTCAPFNTTAPETQVGDPNNKDQITNPIGFVDQATNIDITRAMLNQAGVDVTFLPIATYNNTMFQTLRVVEDATNQECPFSGGTISGFTSCNLLSLSQQPDLSQVVGYMPTPPLAPEPTVINMFFVTRLIAPPQQEGGTLYGFSWINNNGIAIGKNTFFPPSPRSPRFDTLAHEVLHNLALTHTEFGAGMPPNLESAGCCTSTRTDLRTEPLSTEDALARLGLGTADQLTLTSQFLPVSQQDRVLMSGLLRDVPDSTLTAMMSGSADAAAATGGVVAAAATPDDSLTLGTNSRSSTSINFEVSGAVSAGNPDESLTALILMLPKGLKFDPRNRFYAYFNPQYVAETEILYGNSRDKENGFCVDPADLGQISDDRYEHHRVPTTQCLLIEFKRPGLQKGQTVRFRVGVSIGGAPITIDELVGGDVTFIFGSDTYATTSALTGPVDGPLMAGSQQPDLRVPTRYVDPSRVLPTGNSPCTVEVDTSLARRPTVHPTTGCPDPRMTGIEDGDPSHEGGQLRQYKRGGIR
jgi:hypothetical protein